mmetsp:Transcript_32888/g.84034  ORF Transcript_32888/g.84034 Transcript_32888/m.84034 type:complete len:239 (+) Transcript_32888:1343-2059(+)
MTAVCESISAPELEPSSALELPTTAQRLRSMRAGRSVPGSSVPALVPSIFSASALPPCRVKCPICEAEIARGAEPKTLDIHLAADDDFEPSATAASSNISAAREPCSCFRGGRHHPVVAAWQTPPDAAPPRSAGQAHRPSEHIPVPHAAADVQLGGGFSVAWRRCSAELTSARDAAGKQVSSTSSSAAGRTTDCRRGGAGRRHAAMTRRGATPTRPSRSRPADRETAGTCTARPLGAL